MTRQEEQQEILEDITIQELYNWAKKHFLLDYKIRIQYRDGGGKYSGYDKELWMEIDEKSKSILL